MRGMAVETIVVSSETTKTDSAVATSRSVNLKALGYSIEAASAIVFSPEFVSESARWSSDAAANFFSLSDSPEGAGADIELSLEDMMIDVTSISEISADEVCWMETFQRTWKVFIS